MTTVAMTAGMVPTALVARSGDGAWRAPMGTVVIGGLILSTVLTLLIVPAGFSLADGFERRLGPWMRNRFLTYRPGDDTGWRAAQGEAHSCRVDPARGGRLWQAHARCRHPASCCRTGAAQMRRTATGMLRCDGGDLRRVGAVSRAAPRLGLCPRLRRSRDGRRAGRLVRGDRPVPPSAGPADPAHRDHPREQGSHRRHHGQFPAREFPHPRGGGAADARDEPGGGGRELSVRPCAKRPVADSRGRGELLVEVLESLDPERLGGQVRAAQDPGSSGSRSPRCWGRCSRR